jgi:hypothetical protein
MLMRRDGIPCQVVVLLTSAPSGWQLDLGIVVDVEAAGSHFEQSVWGIECVCDSRWLAITRTLCKEAAFVPVLYGVTGVLLASTCDLIAPATHVAWFSLACASGN